jgi:hypothetical protein
MVDNTTSKRQLQPADYCAYALGAIEVSEARRKRRKRDTGPDIIGMDIKRELLRQAVEGRPAPEEFESWLVEQVIRSNAGGPVRAMADEILADYRNASAIENFQQWLEDGAPTPRFEAPHDSTGRRKEESTRSS